MCVKQVCAVLASFSHLTGIGRQSDRGGNTELSPHIKGEAQPPVVFTDVLVLTENRKAREIAEVESDAGASPFPELHPKFQVVRPDV